MLSTARKAVREFLTSMNLGLGKVAPFTHFIPAGPRRIVRDILIKITKPKEYRPPVSTGIITAPPGINEYGLFQLAIGLAQGARLYAKSMIISDFPSAFINVPSWNDLPPTTDHSMDNLLSHKGKYAINVIHINANLHLLACSAFPHSAFDNHYNIGVWLWELERFPRDWLKALEYVDELWAPSQFIADAAKKDTDKPVTVIPYGIETPVDHADRAAFGLPEDTFLVLSMYDSNSFASRKNPEGAISAFVEAFGGQSSNTALVLKVHNSKAEELETLRHRLKKNGINYFLITDSLPKPRLNALISCCDVFLSLHRSEGFGLVIAEAMNLGVPVVATGWSANAEFMPVECTFRVGYRLVPVGQAYQFEDASYRWAEPNIHEAAEDLRILKANPDLAREMAEKARNYIQENYSPEASAEKMSIRYKEICEILRTKRRIS